MSITNSSMCKNPSVKLTESEIENIKFYIKGAVDGFCNNNSEPFSVRILFGGENADWHFTPLQTIYDYYVSVNDTAARKKAAVDAGIFLKQVLADDDRWEYEMLSGRVNEYKRSRKLY